MTRIIQVDENQHELSPHGTLLYPLEVNHDDLSTFQNGFVRCHWHEEVEFSIVRKGRARYSLPGGAVELGEGQGILINANVPHSSAPADEDNALLLTVIVHPALVYGLPGSEIDTQLLRPFLQSRHLAWLPLTQEEMDGLRQVDRLTRERPFAWQLKCKQLLCGVFVTLLCRRGQDSSGQTDFSFLSRLENMLAFLHSRYDQPLDLTALSRQCCLSRESDHFPIPGGLPGGTSGGPAANRGSDGNGSCAAMRLQQRGPFFRRFCPAHAHDPQGLPAIAAL